MSADGLERLSTTLHEVHRAAQDVAFEKFQPFVLQHLQRALRIDKAWWGINADRHIHTSVALHLPPSHLADWQSTKEWDPIAEEAISHPGQTAMFNSDRLRAMPRKWAWLQRYGIAHVLSTTYPHPTLNITSFLSLYRTRVAFNESERRLVQCLMPHLALALTANWMKHLRMQGASALTMAIVDASGLIHCAEAAFAELLHEEWPQWVGPFLPIPWRKVASAPSAPLVARHIQVEIEPLRDLYLLRLSRRSPLLLLTARERSVAHEFAEGKSYKEVAQGLSLAPATVRHYLRNVYFKLGVTNKAELIRIATRDAGIPFI